MKSIRLVILTALSFVTMQSFAQTPINSLRQMFSTGAVSVELEYDLNVPGTLVAGKSTVLLQGQMYHVHADGLDVYNDGKTMWTVDDSAREVIIESSVDVSEDYRGNPVLLLSRMDDFFVVKSCKTIKSQTEYHLEAVSDCGISKADLLLASDGTLVRGVFSLDDSNVLTVNVISMKKTEESPVSSFSPQIKFGSDWIVTDLR